MENLVKHIDAALRTHDGLTKLDIDYAREQIISFPLHKVAVLLTCIDRRGYIAGLAHDFNVRFDEIINKRQALTDLMEDAFYLDKVLNMNVLSEDEQTVLIQLAKVSITLHENILYKIIGKVSLIVRSPELHVQGVLIRMPEYVWINVKDKYYSRLHMIKRLDLIKALATNTFDLCLKKSLPESTCITLREKYRIDILLYS